jgi:hypothetical protein
MKFWLVGCLLMVASVGWGKTKMLVEDPENVAAGRYALTREQKAEAAQTAEALLNSMKEKDRQKALSMRYVAVDAGPLTSSQAAKEPESLRKTRERLARFDIAVRENQTLRPVAIYDTECRRIIHGRLYTATELPPLHYHCRLDDYLVFYAGGVGGFSKEGKQFLR